MRAWLLWLTVLVASCATLPPAPPIPPRPPNVPLEMGVTFSPFSLTEWAEFAWVKLWRVEGDQAADVIAHGADADLLAACEDDQSVTALMPFMATAPYVELGNECNFAFDPVSMGQWTARMIVLLRDSGYAGTIVTNGIGNINPDTVKWWQTFAQAAQLQPDIVAGWHAYSEWETNLPAWVAALNGRRHAMTESGYPNTPATEQQIAVQFNHDISAVYNAGALFYVGYQLHDGPPNTSQNTFGLIEWATGRLRPDVGTLQAWSAK